jgi:glycosyltransferase involved in cell wall biosynthesis
LRKLLINSASAAILYDEDRKEKLVKLGISETKLFVADNSIDIEAITQLRQANIRHNRFRILSVGRIISTKKLNLLLDGFALSRLSLPSEIRLTIIGDGPERRKLQEQAQNLGIDSFVDFTGEIFDESTLAQYFNESLLVVSPGRIGLLGIHALAYGVPLIIADNEAHGPEFHTIISKQAAVLFRSDSSKDLSQTIIHLLNNVEHWHNLQQSGMNIISEKFGIERMVHAFEVAVASATSASNQNAI